MYQFPYEFVPRNSEIVIYGGGAVGRSFISQISDTGYCHIVGILDRNPSGIQIPEFRIHHITEVDRLKYDFLVIAIDSLSMSEQIKTDLLRLGVREDKMVFSAIGLLEAKIKKLMDTDARLFLDNIGSRLDQRLVRLEILQYYSIEKNRSRLDADGGGTLKEVQEFCDLGTRIFPEDRYYEESGPVIPAQYTKENLFFDANGYYCLINKTKLYLGFNKLLAEAILKGFWIHYERDNPHTYLKPEDDGVDLPEAAIIADVGAAEGYFGIKHLRQSKKVYFFEAELEWIEELNKSLSEDSKAEVVRAIVGDEDGHLRLDDFFAERQKPNVIKIDVEGAEFAVLRGMSGLLDSEDPLLLLIATYHRQEDWDRIVKVLNPPGEKPRFQITHSRGYYWHLPDPKPPYFRRGIMRAKKIIL